MRTSVFYGGSTQQSQARGRGGRLEQGNAMPPTSSAGAIKQALQAGTL